jgi:NAD(P)-dependent dehydrogenase (short-subunit alcohol dehydrogenase family)
LLLKESDAMTDPEYESYHFTPAHPTRRRLLAAAGSAAGVSVALASQRSWANSFEPPQPATVVDRNERFAGKVVAVTGGNSGIGEATVVAFAMAGASVMFCARRDALGRQVEAELRESGCNVTWRRTDVREPSDVRGFIEATVATYGRIDVLFNNAGIFMTPAPVEDITVENFQDMLATNAAGVFYGMKFALPVMKRQGGGVIVNMASVAAHRGFANTAHYNASKHAVIGLTRAAATAAARDNIRIVSLSPLAVDTPMLRESFAYQNVSYEAAGFVTPRIMTPHEIAEAVMFLASDSATAVNGTDLDVTGGQLA